MQLFRYALATGLLSSVFASPVEQRTSSCSQSYISDTQAQRVIKAFAGNKITPQVIPYFNPTSQVNVVYGTTPVDLGTVLSVPQTIPEPQISFSAEPGVDAASTKYTIIMIDPDAPMPTADGTPAALSPFLHLLVYNASPKCISSANYGGGTTLAIYKSPTPLSVANHRYIQLVYRQPPNYTPPPSLNYLVPAKFDINGYAAAGGLKLVGGNFFLEGLGSTVPIA